MTSLGNAVGLVAPFYNLALVVIVLLLFNKLFSTNPKNSYLTPWKLLWIAVLIYVLEQVLSIFNLMEIFYVPRISNAIFELIIITIFIYLLLLQKEHLKNA